MEKAENIEKIFSTLIDVGMILAPSIGYITQAYKFHRTKSTKGFELKMSLFIILANSLRIFFWMGVKFTIVLVFQSMVVITCQFFMIHNYLKYPDNDNIADTSTEAVPIEGLINDHNLDSLSYRILKLGLFNFTDTFSLEKFWKWRKEEEYYKKILPSTLETFVEKPQEILDLIKVI